jgi:hypothetical protein
VPPVTLQVREQESGRFLAQWRVPQQLPPQAIPSPVLPESCRPVGEREVTERPGAWFLRQVYDCADGLSGQEIGVAFPGLNAAVSTILRVELLSGDRFAHSFAPGDETWQVPDVAAGDARAVYREARDAVVSGARHFLGNGVHWMFVLVSVLIGAPVVWRLAAAFAGAQLVGLLMSSVLDFQLAASMAEVGVGAGVVLLAREGLRGPGERRQVAALAACAGLVHGMGLARSVAPPESADSLASVVWLALAVLGMDAALLVAAFVGSALGSLKPEPTSQRAGVAVAYVAAIGAVALAIGLPTTGAGADTESTATTLTLPDLPVPEGGVGTSASRSIAARLPDAAVQSFVTVAPFEVRHEVLVRLRELAPELGLPATGAVIPEELDRVKRELQQLLMARHSVGIDESEVDPVLVRTDFLTLDDRGVLPRQTPVAEDVEAAWIGLTVAYLTPKTPTSLTLSWDLTENQAVIPATITDPEATRSTDLTAAQPVLEWSNELAEDPTPVVEALAVEPTVLWVPVLALLVAGIAILLAVTVSRRGRGVPLGVVARVALATACVLAPVGAVAVPLPGGLRGVPNEQAAHRILSRLLPSVYRAFEFSSESAVYDRLALSVTDDALAEIYLEHRRAVEVEERGGARARVEAVELLGVGPVEAAPEDGFVVEADWTVGGTVTHFGHRHFRRNLYTARATVVPVDGTWKIHSIEVFDEQRLQ